jgi:hypothetical protein
MRFPTTYEHRPRSRTGAFVFFPSSPLRFRALA